MYDLYVIIIVGLSMMMMGVVDYIYILLLCYCALVHTVSQLHEHWFIFSFVIKETIIALCLTPGKCQAYKICIGSVDYTRPAGGVKSAGGRISGERLTCRRRIERRRRAVLLPALLHLYRERPA